MTNKEERISNKDIKGNLCFVADTEFQSYQIFYKIYILK